MKWKWLLTAMLAVAAVMATAHVVHGIHSGLSGAERPAAGAMPGH
jgi:hypothetical protein